MSIEAVDLGFAYRKRDVLSGVSFKAERGEVLCVLGQNGAGKSTLFRCILGLTDGYRGKILLDGEDAATMSEARLAQAVAYIPQTHSPVFNYSVQNIVLMGTASRVGRLRAPDKTHDRIAREALERLGIGHLSDRGYAEISGGERQLVLIARALAQQSSMLIMDEPTANLDYGNQAKVMLQIKMLAESGYLVILSTHNPEHALLYSDRTMVIEDGRIRLLGPSETVLTEQVVSEIYDIPVAMRRVEVRDKSVTVVVPALCKSDLPDSSVQPEIRRQY